MQGLIYIEHYGSIMQNESTAKLNVHQHAQPCLSNPDRPFGRDPGWVQVGLSLQKNGVYVAEAVYDHLHAT